MLIKRPDDIAAAEITDESIYLGRRRLLRTLGLAGSALLVGCSQKQGDTDAKADAQAQTDSLPTINLARKTDYANSEAQTSFKDATHYNNYYEFGTDKSDPAQNSAKFQPKPWSVEIAGHAEVTGNFTLEDILKSQSIEERVYRMRCVEGWSMVIPWAGFSLADLLKRFKPTAQAKYIAFTTVNRPAQMPGLSYAALDWPYREGLRIDEAMNPLALLATGMYGRELPNQNGAPLRLVLPWKYGFKGIKSIVKIEFVERQPRTSWNDAAANEYGFYSNVNPEVDHPRWSQKTERRIGAGGGLFAPRIETKPFNGYAEQVASLYAGMDLHQNF